MKDKIKEIIEKIRPSLQADGGDLQFINFDQRTGTVKIELLGHCAHCPMSQITLKEGIEKEIKRAVPKVKKVIAV